MGKRLLGVLVLAALLGSGLFAVPAMAVEATEGAAEEPEGPAPDIGEIGTQNEVSREFLPAPDEAEPPSFFQFFKVPLFAVGVLAAVALLFAYLIWQPRFAQERRSKRRRR
ncbi:MAG: hypothetical protein M3493_09700 [Actinomycetota bacterium]|jgi:hypothetical protein|nr:hypothetical protein [Euzebyaceae bacterium]MBA3622196.1 hypothetical protein [Euzebyales bacterium]MDQ3452949.1 hypothetical protein [Actinomycetota bacterium]